MIGQVNIRLLILHVHLLIHSLKHLCGIPESYSILRNSDVLFSITNPHWSLLQPKKAFDWTLWTESGILIDTKFIHPSKALFMIVWTEFDGMRITSKFVHSLSAFCRIVISESGKLKYLTGEFGGSIMKFVLSLLYRASFIS